MAEPLERSSLTPLSSLSSETEPLRGHSTTRTEMWVELPTLTSEQKKMYRPVFDVPPTGYPKSIDEIVGQYPSTGTPKYYFARFQGGICHRFKAKELYRDRYDLVSAFKRKRREGTLQFPRFDPSAGYVHPLSRIANFVDLKNRRASVSSAYSGTSIPSNSDSSDLDQSSDGIDFADQASDSDTNTDEEEDEHEKSLVRRSTRQGNKSSRLALPFSPRKTRSQKITVFSSDEEGEEIRMPVRRSGRNKRTMNVPLHDEDYSDDSEAEDDEDDYRGSLRKGSKGNKPMKPRRKVTPAAYGSVRPVEDIEFDEIGDDETAVFREHRSYCEKCLSGPSHIILQNPGRKKKKGRPRRKSEDADLEISSDDEARAKELGGWVRCLKCPVSNHWKCVPGSQRDMILRAILEKDRAAWRASLPDNAFLDEEGNDIVPDGEPRKRRTLELTETTEFICAACTKQNYCIGCEEVICFQPESAGRDDALGDVQMEDGTKQKELLFRCVTCKRPCHYHELTPPEVSGDNNDVADVAQYYQQSWVCHDCKSFGYKVDKIIAWRPHPPHAVESAWPVDQPNHWKNALPREYLVKWDGRSYRRAEWKVPHMWLVSTAQAKLRHFLLNGSPVELLETSSVADNSENPTDAAIEETSTELGPIPPIRDAFERIPPAWKTVDRLLDVRLWKFKQKKGGKSRVIVSEDEDEEDPIRDAAYRGEEPGADAMETVEAFERRTKTILTAGHIDQVAWSFIKWRDLGYEDASWDSPPRPGESTYTAFESAFRRFVDARQVEIPKRSSAELTKFEHRPPNEYRLKHRLKDASRLDLGQDPNWKLMPFQVEGFNWLCDNWWRKQPCILADEMGLGKTVQISSFIGRLIKDFNASPALVVVPNSTITNWVREFERWAPNLTVVPFYGESRARDVIKSYELKHSAVRHGTTGSRFHVLIATYESVIGQKDFTPIFKNQPRWEILVIDEGQRLKSDSSLLFKKLNELNTAHRVIMTGTPLNNNIRELFNLMNFLDPGEWKDLEALEREYEELTEERVKELHTRLRPYFLRRIKSEVISLPPKNEVIVPVTMTPLQKELYKTLVVHNSDLFSGIGKPANSKAGQQNKSKIANLMMELRKLVQHPYLHNNEIEDRHLSDAETHHRLIDASAKLRLLKMLLPQLKARGHRVLLFSQFKIALDIVQDFLAGEGLKFLRLDGDITGIKRQRGMDEFNKPGSEYFIYLLTTRAGGVGINLFTADTVIIFDPDFNPHQDLQAIARAHRFGQKKTCLVFKLMVRDTVEEKIIQKAKGKLVLDHLIVQKMDAAEEGGEDVQSMLTHGAKALFDDEQGARDIHYTDDDVLQLIEKTETQPPEENTKTQEGALAFSFAKVWDAGNASLQDVQDNDPEDSWAETLSKINQERAMQQSLKAAKLGRGVRRAAAQAMPAFQFDEESPAKVKSKTKRTSPHSDGSVYGAGSDSDDSDSDTDTTSLKSGDAAVRNGLTPAVLVGSSEPSTLPEFCGLCQTAHLDGQCPSTSSSEFLAEYRSMLLDPSCTEPFDERLNAIHMIDQELHRRGAIRLIEGQALHLAGNHAIPRATVVHPPTNIQQVPVHPANSLAPSAQPGPSRPPMEPQRSASGQSGASFGSKRSASPAAQPVAKKPRVHLKCPICSSSPSHPIERCPTVLQKGAHVAIALVQDRDPETARALRELRKAQKEKERAVRQSEDGDRLHW